MSYDYSENILVQESAGHLLEDELGWRVELAYNTEVLGETGTFGRKSYKEILLVKYLKEALLKLNPWLTPALLEDAIKTFESHMSSASLMQINEENYRHIRDGIPVKVKKQNGQIEEKKAIVIDFTNPENNDFLAIREMKIHGDLYRRRTDIVGFVNGIPLLFIELKKNSVDVQNAYTDNYTDYLDTIPHKYGGGSKVYHVEHFAPKEKFPELKFQYDNLLYACPFCNISKSNKWPSDSSTVAVVGNKGFIDPCTYEYEKHLGRHTSGEIYYKTALGKYMFYEMKLYLQRHQLIYNLGRVHAKLKEVKKEIDRREHVHKPTEDLTELYKELCVIFFEYYNAFSEEVE